MFFLLVNTWINNWGSHRHSCRRPPYLAVHFPSRGRARWDGRRRWRLSRRCRSPKKRSFYFTLLIVSRGGKLCSFFGRMVYFCCLLLSTLAAKREPTPGHSDAYSAGTQKWALWEKHGQKKRQDHTFPLGQTCFSSQQKDHFLFLGGWLFGCSTLVGPGILVLVNGFFTPGQLSVEFVNVGGWLTCGDLALDSCAQFLAVAEHRLIPSRARSICHQLRKAGYQSVWSPACQDQVAGGHAGVGVVSLGGPCWLAQFCNF